MIDPDPIRKHFASLSLHLSERERRLLAAAVAAARSAGYAAWLRSRSNAHALSSTRNRVSVTLCLAIRPAPHIDEA